MANLLILRTNDYRERIGSLCAARIPGEDGTACNCTQSNLGSISSLPSCLAWDNDVFSIITYVIIHKTSSVYEGQATEFKFSAVSVGFSGGSWPCTELAGCVFPSQNACCRRKKRSFLVYNRC